MDYLLEDNAAGTRVALRRVLASLLLLAAAGCSSLGATGPSTRAVMHSESATVAQAQIKIIPVTDAVARRVLAAHESSLFSEKLGDAPIAGTTIGRGDVLQVTIWEAPPALLFGGSQSFGSPDTSALLDASNGLGLRTGIPEMMVDDNGQIRVPFAGSIQAAGRTPRQVEREITARLAGKAHDPQVTVQISRNQSANVTVVGEVVNNTRVPLTPRGERLLDIIAAAGGVKQPVGKVTIQITRGDTVAYLPLEAVIRDPAQNIRLGPNDVVTALFQPFSFTALGATGTSAEVPFESTGLTLAQALGRDGGLKEDRADIRGAFIFRLEDPKALDPAVAATARRTPDGRIPVIYRIDLGDPSTFFAAQSFPMQDKDVLYVSRAPLADLQRFVSIVASMAFPVINISRNLP